MDYEFWKAFALPSLMLKGQENNEQISLLTFGTLIPCTVQRHWKSHAALDCALSVVLFVNWGLQALGYEGFVPLGFWFQWCCPNPALLGALKHFAGADWGGDILPPPSGRVNFMEILMGCTALLADPWEWLQHWGLKRVPWDGVEGSAPAAGGCAGGSAGSSWGTRGLCLAKNSSGLLWVGRKEQILNNDPKQVHGCANHTEELWWLVTSNIKSLWCLDFCGISVESGIIQIVPVVLPGKSDCCSRAHNPIIKCRIEATQLSAV